MTETKQTNNYTDLYYVICPVKGAAVTILEQHLVRIPDDQASWWRCPMCQGWHIFLAKKSTLSCKARLMIREKKNGSDKPKLS